MTDPRTEAGRRLLDEWTDPEGYRWVPLVDIAAIETEAVTAALERLRAVVEGLERYEALSPLVYGVTPKGSAIERAAVLYAIDEEKRNA